MKFSYREYQPGDEDDINNLYFAITGNRRSKEEHAWQWLESPAGKSEMWLIEAELDNGEKKLIGHHGVMAVNFSYKGEKIRVGKTENTMVLPEFREKILYARYEKYFLSQYENRFQALFSTRGPDSAIKLRKMMGYRATYSWQKIYLGVEPFISFSVIGNKFLKKNRTFPLNFTDDISINNTKISIYNKENMEFDFNEFWSGISNNYFITPARTKENLNWRFWNNPYREHITTILDSEILGVAVCTLSFRNSYTLYIEDIYCDLIENIPKFLDILHAWAKMVLKISILESTITTDTLIWFTDEKIKHKAWIDNANTLFKKSNNQLMPRKIVTGNSAKQIENDSAWYVTPFFFEGR